MSRFFVVHCVYCYVVIDRSSQHETVKYCWFCFTRMHLVCVSRYAHFN